MPIYEYECKTCGQVTELLQKISDSPLKKCPDCGGRVSKLMSMNTFHLKGSGWYVTDYAGKKAPKTETAEKGKPAADSTCSAPAPKETKKKKDA